MKKLAVYLELMRLPIVVVSALMAIEGYFLVTHQFSLNLTALLLALVFGAAYAASNVLNDILDLNVDKLNYPDRPLPTGQLSEREAVIFAVGLYIASAGFALGAGWNLFLIVLGLLSLSVYYNFQAKKIPVLGSVIVAFLSAMILGAGYFVVRESEFPLVPVLAGFLFILAREFVDTISDEAGDRLGGRHTLLMMVGKTNVLRICLAIIILCTIILLLPIANGTARSPLLYGVGVTVLTLVPVYWAVVQIGRDPSPTNIGRVVIQSRLFFFTTLISLLLLV